MTDKTDETQQANSLAVPGRWLTLVGLGSGALAAVWAALVFASGTWVQARALDKLFPYYDWHIRFFGPAGWARQQELSAALATGLAGSWLVLAATRWGRRELAAAGHELRALTSRLRGQWWALRRGQRRFFAAHLLALTAARVYLSFAQHWADDAVSFEFFVRQRLLAVAAYYPLPNNHIGSNALNRAFYLLHPTFWASMRLPVLLTATGGTLLLFGVLWRRLGYWPALLAAGLMSWVQLSLYHAAAGRGYWLVVAGTALVFGSMLHLLDGGDHANANANAPAAPRLAWLGLVAGSIVGSYAVPTFAYVLATAFSWLGLQALRPWRGALLAGTVAAGAAVAGATVLLYWPALYVSGSDALLHNPYVLQLPAGKFWQQAPAHLWRTEGYLLGPHYVGMVGLVLGLALFGRAWRRARAGQLPPALARALRQVGWPALWFLLVPYAVVAVQRVLPPERTWLYKSWFLFVLGALGLAAWPALWRTRGRRRALGVGVALFVAYQLAGQWRLNRQAYAQVADRQATYEWLRRHPARPVLVPELYLWAWLRFAAHLEAPDQPWPAEQVPRPGVAYAYVVTRRGDPAPTQPARLVFAVGNVLVYQPLPALPHLPAPLPAAGSLFWEKRPI